MPEYLICKRKGNSLIPSDSMSENLLSEIPEDKEVKVVVSVPRSLKKHRLFFGLLAIVIKNQPDPPHYLTVDDLLDDLKKAMGYMTERKDWNGDTYFVPKSIAFHKLDETGFRDFFNRAVDLILLHVLPNCDKPSLEIEVMNALGLPLPR